MGATFTALSAAGVAAAAEGAPTIELFASSADHLWNGVAVTPDGRVFVSLPPWLGPSAGVGEIVDGALQPWPGSVWNGAEGAPEARLVNVNAIRLDPGRPWLWVVDSGAIPGGERAKGAAKLVAFDLATGEAVRNLALDPVLPGPRDAPNDLRIRGSRAYVSEPGGAAILTVDLETGQAGRWLAGHPLLTARPDKLVVIEGKVLNNPAGKPFLGNANQLELSPDGATLFIQPLSGGMARVPTAKLDAGMVEPDDLTAWVDTPPTSGTAMDTDGNLYLNAINERAVFRFAPDGTRETLVRDERLRWADASWIEGGYLWLPIAQLAWTPFLNGGVSLIEWPSPLYRVRL